MFVTSQLSEMSPLLSAFSRLEEPLDEGGVREGEVVRSALPSVSAMGSDGCSLPWLPVVYTIWLDGAFWYLQGEVRRKVTHSELMINNTTVNNTQ